MTTGHNTKTPSATSGFFAVLCGRLRVQGSGASATKPTKRLSGKQVRDFVRPGFAGRNGDSGRRPVSPGFGRRNVRILRWGSGASSPRIYLTGSVIAAALCLVCLAPSTAGAAFTRPFRYRLTGTPTGAAGANVPFWEAKAGEFLEVSRNGPLGIAVDGSGNLWVADRDESSKLDYLDEFSSAGVFVGPEPGPEPLELKGVDHKNLSDGEEVGETPPESLSLDSTGDFYVTGKSTEHSYQPYVEVFDSSGGLISRPPLTSLSFVGPAHVAVDDSTDPFDLSPGSVYVSHGRRRRVRGKTVSQTMSRTAQI